MSIFLTTNRTNKPCETGLLGWNGQSMGPCWLLTLRPCWFLELRSKFLVPFFIFSIYNLLKISFLGSFYLIKLKTHHCWLEQSNHFVGKGPGKTVQMWSKSKRQINHKVIRMMDLKFDKNLYVIRDLRTARPESTRQRTDPFILFWSIYNKSFL